MRQAVIVNGTVENVILAPEGFTVPGAVLAPSETAAIGQLWDGEAFSDPPPTPPVLPDLTMRQFRLGLLNAGLLDDVEAAIDDLPEPDRSVARIEFEYASLVVRTDPWVAALAVPLGLSEGEIDDLWTSAAAL